MKQLPREIAKLSDHLLKYKYLDSGSPLNRQRFAYKRNTNVPRRLLVSACSVSQVNSSGCGKEHDCNNKNIELSASVVEIIKEKCYSLWLLFTNV